MVSTYNPTNISRHVQSQKKEKKKMHLFEGKAGKLSSAQKKVNRKDNNMKINKKINPI